jgi:O-antigen ligase/tetratricopeptide (TPR) repeat protein
MVLVMVVLSPWAFGAVHDASECVLYVGAAVLALLWGLRMLVEGRVTLKKCPVQLCLAALVLLGAWQLVSLPPGALERLAPGTWRLRAEFLPEQAEQVADADREAFTSAPENSTISLNPGATRRVALQLVAFLVVFTVVRNNLDPARALKHLSIAAVVNGALLAVVALAQFFSTGRHTLYWHFQTRTNSFGPFVCRNHFPFYVNICIGLGLGLLLAFHASEQRRSRGSLGLVGLLQRPRVLWVSAALALMACSAVLSLSRGGTVALVAALVVCILLLWARLPRTVGAATTLAVVLMALCLLLWFGWKPVEARLATLWRGDAAQEEGRLPMWLRVLPLARNFPVWGSGYGTFDTIEWLNRPPSEGYDSFYEYAHNDYLEALLEGGVLRLGLTLAVIAFVFWLGYRACRRFQGRTAGGLALGALAGFTTVVVHSAVDFGLHVPAIALLTAVVIALLAGLGALARGKSAKHGEFVWQLGGLAPILGLAVVATLGGLLVHEGWRRQQAALHRWAAVDAHKTGTPEGRDAEIRHLQAALVLVPEDAYVQCALGDAYAQQFARESSRLRRTTESDSTTRTLLAFMPVNGTTPHVVATALALDGARHAAAKDTEERAAQRYIPAALRCYLRARDLCPLKWKPQIQLATFNDRLQNADSRRTYLERAQRLRLPDGELAFVLGEQCLLDGEQAEAWRAWKHSLECSDRRFKEIVVRSSKCLDAQEMVRELLPSRPDLLCRAAFQLNPDPKPDPRRRIFLEAALALLEQPSNELSAADLHLKARTCQELERPEEALKAYRIALIHAPSETAWRFEYAQLLLNQGHQQEALEELRHVLSDQPWHPEAKAQHRDLLESLDSRP